jgi:hypothetical protein
LIKPLQKTVLLLLFFFAALAGKAQQPSAVNQIKAVFLYNFTQFVTWPPTAFVNDNSPFVIGVLGSDPFGTYLEKVVEGEKVSGRPIVIRRYSHVNEVKNCHILFVTRENTGDAVRELNGRSVLTVSDKQNFARDGGMIGFYLEKNKIRLQINPKTAKEANLAISSKLLRLANLVDE